MCPSASQALQANPALQPAWAQYVQLENRYLKGQVAELEARNKCLERMLKVDIDICELGCELIAGLIDTFYTWTTAKAMSRVRSR
jgi:hypothetical protein